MSFHPLTRSHRVNCFITVAELFYSPGDRKSTGETSKLIHELSPDDSQSPVNYFITAAALIYSPGDRKSTGETWKLIHELSPDDSQSPGELFHNGSSIVLFTG